jgi:1-acyl-sn-glycerol-3-phosphate acyltransferase
MADCTMVNCVTFPNKVYLPTIHTTFQLPYIRHLVKGLNAIPIPEGIKAMSKFMSEIDNLLKEGKIVHFYPESALWPWYDKVREFKTGAFRFAVMNNVPILPMCFKFEERKGLHKLIFKKPMVRMYILDPIYPNMTINKKQAVNELCDKTHNIIKEFVENKN